MLRKGQRVVILADGKTGEVTGTEWVLGERDDPFSERHVHVLLDEARELGVEVSVAEAALARED